MLLQSLKTIKFLIVLLYIDELESLLDNEHEGE